MLAQNNLIEIEFLTPFVFYQFVYWQDTTLLMLWCENGSMRKLRMCSIFERKKIFLKYFVTQIIFNQEYILCADSPKNFMKLNTFIKMVFIENLYFPSFYYILILDLSPSPRKPLIRKERILMIMMMIQNHSFHQQWPKNIYYKRDIIFSFYIFFVYKWEGWRIRGLFGEGIYITWRKSKIADLSK